MSDTTLDSHTESHTWVAFGPSGALGSIHGEGDKYTVRILADESWSAVFPSLEVAKRALHSRLTPGSEWPDFREH